MLGKGLSEDGAGQALGRSQQRVARPCQAC